MINSLKIGRNVEIVLKEYERFLSKSFHHYPPSKQVYHPDVRLDVLMPNLADKTISIGGFKKYKAAMWLFRSMILLRYIGQQPRFCIERRHQPEATSLHVNWSLRTKGLVRWEGISAYDFEPTEGRITRHLLHSITPPPSYWFRFLLYWFHSSPTLPSPTFFNNNSSSEANL